MANGAPFDVVPEIIHLHLVPRERFVLFDQYFTEIERPPSRRAPLKQTHP
jgi:hypothetical protein